MKPLPVGRDFHAAVHLGYGELLITGGKDKNVRVLRDAWIFSLNAQEWREVRFIVNLLLLVGWL